ncbi:hypothetical protein [Luteimonas sp. J16]|uniref:hypothetical protein n=1 Tax=Luteimonas sp. J16 TaxID=935283 RepID=UPI001647AE8C|nr:hypothetical protein [Luteimonas sp. J16]
MKVTPAKVVLVALAAGGLGLLAGLMVTGGGPIWGTDTGQRLLNDALTASAPPLPDGGRVARRAAAGAAPGHAGRRPRAPAP